MRTIFSVNLGIDAVQKRSFDFSFPSLLQPLIATDIPLGADQARPSLVWHLGGLSFCTAAQSGAWAAPRPTNDPVSIAPSAPSQVLADGYPDRCFERRPSLAPWSPLQNRPSSDRLKQAPFRQSAAKVAFSNQVLPNRKAFANGRSLHQPGIPA